MTIVEEVRCSRLDGIENTMFYRIEKGVIEVASVSFVTKIVDDGITQRITTGISRRSLLHLKMGNVKFRGVVMVLCCCGPYDDDERLIRGAGLSGSVMPIHIDGVQCDTVDNLLKEWASKLRFPDYFGYNWMAFDECLNNVYEWHDHNILIVIDSADMLLSSHREADRNASIATLMAILRQAGHDAGDPSVSVEELDRVQQTPVVFSSSSIQSLPKLVATLRDEHKNDLPIILQN